MPQGLANAPSTCQRTMDKVFGHINDVIVYMDDIIVASSTIAEHKIDLMNVLMALRNAGFTVKPKKCNIGSKEINILGHIINEYGVQIDKTKIEAIEKVPIPRTMRQIRSFLGMCTFYSRFIKHYADIAEPITRLLKKTQKLKWSEDQNKSFHKLCLNLDLY
jgi:hypothetical protein